MTRNEYVERVLSVMRHVTEKEREAIRAEIDAHIEDHICDLLDLDYDEALAEERAMALMGDPEEVGRELDKQYPCRIHLGRILAGLLAACMIFWLLGSTASTSPVYALKRRWYPAEPLDGGSISKVLKEEQGMDLRASVGDDELRIMRIQVGNRQQESGLWAEVYAEVHDQIPLGKVETIDLILENQNGERSSGWIGGWSHWWGWGALEVPIHPEDTYITLIYDAYGTETRCRLSLPEEWLT